MTRRVRRATVYRYKQSEKLSAIFSRGGYIGFTAIDLSSDMRSIVSIRNPKFVKREAFEATHYQIEVAEEQVSREGKVNTFRFQLVRVLPPEDIDLSRWTKTESLEALPVSPEPEITPEELAWAGRRSGNVGGGIAIGTLAVGGVWFAVVGYVDGSSYLFSAIVAAAAVWFLARYKWKLPRKPRPVRLDELKTYKERLRHRTQQNFVAAQTEFDIALEDYNNWSALTPQLFEFAVARRLEAEGYRVAATRYSKDGGVDVEGTDREGVPVIVQAKRFRSKVGVSVVREMMGTRQTYPNSPRAIIYSLTGFTRDAKKLAREHNAELRTVRSELLKT